MVYYDLFSHIILFNILVEYYSFYQPNRLKACYYNLEEAWTIGRQSMRALSAAAAFKHHPSKICCPTNIKETSNTCLAVSTTKTIEGTRYAVPRETSNKERKNNIGKKAIYKLEKEN